MTIGDIDIYEYALPFQNPITMMRHQLTERRGLVLSIKNKDGCEGLGDIAPFPGLSRESLEQAKRQVKKSFPSLLNSNLLNFDDIETLTSNFLPSVRFGVESAFCDLEANKKNVTIGELFIDTPLKKINVNALLADAKNVSAKVIQIRESNYRAIKVKVGRRKIEDEIEFVRTVRRHAGKEIAIRLDANRAWTLSEAVRFADGVRNCGIEYIEEPLASESDFEFFYKKTGMPIALDESLTPVMAANPPHGVAAFILKPGIHGGIFDIIGLINQAQIKNIEPILSSPFLSAIGLNMALHIASAFTSKNSVMGLGLMDFFKADMLKRQIGIVQGAIDVCEFNDAVALNTSVFIGAGRE